MGTPVPPSSGANRIVNARALWAGGAATAVVAALVAVVGVLICEGVLDLDMAPPPLLPIGSRCTSSTPSLRPFWHSPQSASLISWH